MKIIETKSLTTEQRQEIWELWNKEYPVGLLFEELADFRAHLDAQGESEHFIILDSEEQIIGWCMLFDRDDGRWFSIIIDADYQGNKLGTRLVKKMKEKESELYGWVVDTDDDKKSTGENYKSPLAFYKKHGFHAVPEERFDNEKVSAIMIRWTKPVEEKDNSLAGKL